MLNLISFVSPIPEEEDEEEDDGEDLMKGKFKSMKPAGLAIGEGSSLVVSPIHSALLFFFFF